MTVSETSKIKSQLVIPELIKVNTSKNRPSLSIYFIVCDDDKFNGDSIKNCLTKMKFNNLDNVKIYTKVCTNGIDCLYEIYSDYKVGKKYSFLFIDENMPGINGSEVIKILKTMIRNKFLNNIKICSITGFENEDFEQNLKNIGCDIIIKKPVGNTKLEAILKDIQISDLYL